MIKNRKQSAFFILNLLVATQIQGKSTKAKGKKKDKRRKT
jgi:hypothetical protein